MLPLPFFFFLMFFQFAGRPSPMLENIELNRLILLSVCIPLEVKAGASILLEDWHDSLDTLDNDRDFNRFVDKEGIHLLDFDNERRTVKKRVCFLRLVAVFVVFHDFHWELLERDVMNRLKMIFDLLEDTIGIINIPRKGSGNSKLVGYCGNNFRHEFLLRNPLKSDWMSTTNGIIKTIGVTVGYVVPVVLIKLFEGFVKLVNEIEKEGEKWSQ